MTDYDLLILSPNEFENISRDLLQKKLSVFIESFTTGKDGGIDLRHSRDNSHTTIIQAKRFKDYPSLYTHLKKEIVKVKSLSPNRYILTTSVGLTPLNKENIKSLFFPFILNTADILGRDDLNNLLGLNKDIEHKYYKLWLSSTNILEKVLHSKIYNQSAFELEEIREQVKLYVQNESFNEALTILKEHRYLIISGIPGIGKTTLARVLILYLLSNEFEEFVYLNQSIDDGYEFFADGKKQVFFFDDFLGKNFFEERHLPNEDNKIVKFIEKIKKSPDKILILATREYILNQAKTVFEAFRINNIEIAKCVLDLSSYTNIIKAQIIYNHLFFAEVPYNHLLDLLERDNHLQLVHHPNYNPRIIETVINRRIWEHCPANKFSEAFKSYFDNPESVWLYAFENSIDKFSQYTMLVLLSMGTPVLIQDLENALKEFLTRNNYKFLISFDSIKYNRAIRELENTFIKTQKDSYSSVAIEYQNPSIQDFLVNYLKDKTDLLKCIIESAIYSDQFFTIFTTDTTDNYSNRRKVLLESSVVDSMVKTLVKNYNILQSCNIVRARYGKSENYIWYKDTSFKYEFLNTINTEIGGISEEAKNLVYEKFQDNIYIDDIYYSEQKSYIDLLGNLDLKKLSFNEEQLVDTFLSKLNSLDNLELFAKVEELFPTIYTDTIQEGKFIKKLETAIKKEMTSVEDSDVYSLKSQLETLQHTFDLRFEDQIDELERRDKAYDDYIDSLKESQIDDSISKPEENKQMSEERVIEEIFNSLVEK